MLPAFDSLPTQKNGPAFNAWGLWGPDDELGRLNLITPKAVQRGRDAIKQSEVINLNIPKDHFNDDVLHFNTQVSTQWDGLRHYPYQNYPSQGEFRYYGGMTPSEACDSVGDHCGIQNYVRKPITSRAHLLDIPRYVKKHGLLPLAPLDNSSPIGVSLLQGCADDQGSRFEAGDILLVRTGWTEAMFALSDEEKLKHRDKSIGVARGDDVLRWHWENGFAAVLSDTRAYELYPHDSDGLSLHEAFLAGWGMPIGELFDLRELAAACERHEQWAFMFTSMPLYVRGGIASPANAQAIL